MVIKILNPLKKEFNSGPVALMTGYIVYYINTLIKAGLKNTDIFVFYPNFPNISDDENYMVTITKLLL